MLEQRQAHMFAKASAKLSVAMRGVNERAVFVAWKADVKESKAFKEQSEKLEHLSGMMMMMGGSDAGTKQVYFRAYREVVYKAKKQRQGTSMVERFARSMGEYMLKETFDFWVRAVAESKRERSTTKRREHSKQYLVKMMAQTDAVLVHTCFTALRSDLDFCVLMRI